MKKRCLIICYTALADDPRVIKHYEALKESYEVFTAGVSAIGTEQKFMKISESHFWNSLNTTAKQVQWKWLLFLPAKLLNFLRFKLFRKLYLLRYWDLKRLYDFIRLRQLRHVELIIANDLNTLPLAAAISGKRTKLVYDAHEYHAEEYAENEFWRHYNQPLINYLHKRYISRADSCMTVSTNIARRYESEYKKPFDVILNAPPYVPVEPSVTNPGKIRLAYSGMYGPSRKVKEIIQAMDLLPSAYELHLLIANQSEELKRVLQKSASAHRIFLHPAVSLNVVSRFLNQFDIGVHLMSANNFNNDNALPNKYFQYIQARLVTVFGPLSEIGAFTRQYDTGIILDAYTENDLASSILKLSVDDISRIKKNNDANAKRFCEENEILKLKQIYQQVMS